MWVHGVLKWTGISTVFLSCTQCARHRLWIHQTELDKAVTKDEW